ncbi:MAG: toxin HipA, partial [Flavobacteriales bacterium CG_4_9_14_0_2_um_filter_35_242]
NPTTYGIGLSLNISENDNALNSNLALKFHEYFRLNKKNALKIIDEVKGAIKN